MAQCSIPGSAQRRAGVVFADSSEWSTLNPLYLGGGSANRLGALVYSQLFRRSADDQLIPSVAAGIPTVANGGIAKGGLLITYHLKREVKWADGEPLTARDVVFTHQAVMNPRNAAVDRRGDERVAAIVATDPFTVTVRLREIYSPFIFEFNRPLLPAHLLQRFASLDRVDYNAHPVGSGPYRVSEWVRGDHITFVRSEAYWGRLPRIATITVRFMPNSSTIVTGLESGEIDGANFVDPVSAKTFVSNPALRTTTVSNAFNVMLFNASHTRLSDVRVRRAVTLAIDRIRLIRTVSEGMTDPSEPDRALFGWAYDPSVPASPYDPKGARRLLDAAGWKPGPNGIRMRSGQQMELTLVTQAGHPELAVEANVIAQDLRVVGIQTNIKLYVDQEYFAAPDGIVFGGRFDITLSRFSAADPPFDVNGYVGCNAAGKPLTYNFTRMCLRNVEPSVRDALSTFDHRRQMHDFGTIQRALEEQAPLVVLSRAFYYYVTSKRLHGFVATPFGEFESVASWSLT